MLNNVSIPKEKSFIFPSSSIATDTIASNLSFNKAVKSSPERLQYPFGCVCITLVPESLFSLMSITGTSTDVESPIATEVTFPFLFIPTLTSLSIKLDTLEIIFKISTLHT